MMNAHRSSQRNRLIVLLSLLLVSTLLLAACGGPSTTGQTGTPTSGKTPTTSTTPTTAPMPATQTSCPPTGTARGAVIAPLVRGNTANVVYVSNQGPEEHPVSGTLKRSAIATKSETVIVTLPHTSIHDAQVSADGQWVLFGATVDNRSAIQLIRMDGQGLQTLYCSTSAKLGSAGALEWSPDQKYVAFLENQNIYLLDLSTGRYRLVAPPSNNVYYVPQTWLDPTRLYLSGVRQGTESALNLYLLDISSAKVQHVLDSPTLCADFDSSIDGRQLFTSQCVFAMPTREGPSSIQVQPAAGGPTTTIYTTPTYGITTLRVASHHTLLFVMYNTGVGSVDTGHNGLWKVNTDGTGLTGLTTELADETTLFNLYTQYVWSTVSRDSTFYAVQVINYASSTDRPISIVIGPLNGGAPFTLAKGTIATGTVALAGWTTM